MIGACGGGSPRWWGSWQSRRFSLSSTTSSTYSRRPCSRPWHGASPEGGPDDFPVPEAVRRRRLGRRDRHHRLSHLARALGSALRVGGRRAVWTGRQSGSAACPAAGVGVQPGLGRRRMGGGPRVAQRRLRAAVPIRASVGAPERARFPAAATWFVARALTGALHERRWLARPAGSGWAVQERVSFGNGEQA